MSICDEFDPDLLEPVDRIASSLHSAAGIDTDHMMVVGAACRDLWHQRQGFGDNLRRTSDVDVALALHGWEPFEKIQNSFETAGHNGVRFLVDGIPVDIVPFGTVEAPAGLVQPASRKEVMVVRVRIVCRSPAGWRCESPASLGTSH